MTCVIRTLLSACFVLLSATLFAQDKFFDSDGVRIRYAERGSGEPIVLVHGFTRDLDIWTDVGVMQDLAQDHRVLALDCRGHGKSDKPHDPKQYGRQMGQDIVRLLDHLELPKAHIVGYSMGAAISAHLLTVNPERFLSATLGGAVGRLRWSSEDDLRAEKEATELEEGMLRSTILRLTPPNEPTPSEDEIRRMSEEILGARDRVALAAVRRSNGDQAVTDAQMAAVRVPILSIIGSKDPNRADVEVLKEIIPSLRVVVIQDATHSGAYRRPEFVDAIREFVASNRGDGK